MPEKNNRQLLDLYLKDELDPDEKAAFEIELQGNPVLFQEWLFLKDAADALILLKRKELQQKFHVIEEEEEARIQEKSVTLSEEALPLIESSQQTPPDAKTEVSFMRNGARLVLLVILGALLIIGVYLFCKNS